MNDNSSHSPDTSHERQATILLGVSSVFFCLCLVFAGGWFLTWRRGTIPNLEQLSPNQAQALVEQFRDRSPSVLRYAFFEPKIGFTLAPHDTLSVWGDTFFSNGLGYRAGPVAKESSTFRVVFVGDSWTYGMGVSEAESFPQQFASIANTHAGLDARVTAWSLALPGYNTINELAALDAFFDILQPDAVILCPTTNDIDGTKKVNLAGHLQIPKRSEWQELFLDWRSKYLDSYLNRTQWDDAFVAFGTTARRMSAAGVPFFLFFSADWLHEPVVHDFMARANVQAPYAIVPREFLIGKWRRSEQFGHGTPEAYTVFANIIYDMVASQLGWGTLPERVKTRDGAEVTIHEGVPAGSWRAEAELILNNSVVAESDFRPGAKHSVSQIMSGVDWKTGAVSSNPGFLLLKREAGSTKLLVHVKSLPEGRFLYPLDISVSIPSASGTVTASGILTRAGGEEQSIAIELPPDIEQGSGIDVIIETPRSVLDRHFVARSFYLVGIDQM